ncbi:MAC/perforin domain-containing protein [Woodsholea maritima]|uniref:MAC/perforin domain-containing protein n=1 Tax=Woodsholea maritima TaxID=240237 RepID=UPI0003613D56|nr:MAC/perforin domain-containing protein [Woodsholea maritima]
MKSLDHVAHQNLLNEPTHHKSNTKAALMRHQENLVERYLPGVEVIGAGYNPFGVYASTDSVTVQLFDWQSAPSEPVIFNPDYIAPKAVSVQQNDEARYTNVSGKTINTFQKNFSLKVTVAGSYNLFSGSVSNEFSSSETRNAENEFSRIQQSIRVWSLRLAYTDSLREYLKADVRDYIDSIQSDAQIEILFDRYGSHFLTGVVMGGAAIMASSTNKVQVDHTYENETIAKASYEALTGQISAETAAKYRQSMSSFSQNSDIHKIVVGGDGVAGAKVYSGDKADFDAWADTVGTSPDFVDFVSSVPMLGIWELCKDDAQAKKMEDYYNNTWAPRKSKEAQIYADYIDAVEVIQSNSSGVRPPSGYTKIDYDLNKGAGGDYIYLCYHKARYSAYSENKDCVSDLIIIKGNGARAPSGYTKIDVDLNEDAGGKYLYLCYKKQSYDNVEAIKGLAVVGGDNSHTPAPYGYRRIDTDVNEGAGGEYIYICYSKGA